jgi:hypothetical protein
MKEQKAPGISIATVRLLKAHVEMVEPEGVREYNLRLISLQRREADEGKALDLFASFDLMSGVEKPLFSLTCDFVARYERQGDDSMPWDEFSSPVALAHIIPYLREFISNMTNRLPIPVLMLDPINTFMMIADLERDAE